MMTEKEIAALTDEDLHKTEAETHDLLEALRAEQSNRLRRDTKKLREKLQAVGWLEG